MTLNILNRLRTTNSTIEKQAMLKDASFDDKRVFQYAYDLKKRYYLKFDTIRWETVNYHPLNIDFMFSILNRLLSKEIYGTNARDTVEEWSAINGDLIKLICNKDLDCGVTATTLNKVFGKAFIPQFKLQGAIKLPWEKIPVPTIGQIKYNGARVVILLTNEDVIFKSRGGHEFEFPRLLNAIRGKPVYEETVIEGELCYGDSQHTNHTKVSGLVNSAIKGTPINDIDLVFTAFDCMSLKEFEDNKCDKPYNSRFKKTNKIVKLLTMDDCGNYSRDIIRLAESYDFNSVKDIQDTFNELLASGYEGLILKQPSSLYTFRKNKNWIKLKNEDPADLLCVGIIEGKDSFAGGIGSLVCEGIVEGKQVKVNVSSGMKEHQRFESVNNYIGKHIEISYNEVIQDSKTGLWSLFIPKFIIVREDKI